MSLKIRFAVVSLLAALLVLPVAGHAELGRDTHVQETGEVRIEVDRQVFEEFARLFGLGYPPATVMMHAVSSGMSINDILYIAVKSDTQRAAEYYDTAASLLPELPGWVCQADADRQRYTREVNLDELGSDPTIAEIAALYFNQDRRVIPFPDWTEGRVHMEASVDELAGLITDDRWYVPGEDDGTPRTAPNRPVFVSLYKHAGEIVVDDVERIRRAQQQGLDTLPVVLVYNNEAQRPVSSFQQDVTVGQLASRFYGEGIELTAVPEWQVGDHHKSASIEELREVVDIPAREDIPEQRWNALEEELQGNDLELSSPLILTLVRSGQGRAWVNDPARVAVASELGIGEFPVVMFYHRIDRQACGQSSGNCEDILCQAATAAGASQEVCSSGGQQAKTETGTDASEPGSRIGSSIALHPDPRIYEGLSYTQNQCTS